MEYEEYMRSLTEQIHCRRAAGLVEEEIRNHIEEQARSYEAEGMEPSAALAEAVRQMGNPVETGAELNRIHRPAMPWKLLFLALFLMLSALAMQAVIFYHLYIRNNGGEWSYLPESIFQNLLGFSIMIGLLFLDYNFIARHAYLLYVLWVLSMIPQSLLLYRVESNALRGQLCYGIWMLYPVIFAGILYRNRNRGVRGILTAVGLCAAAAGGCVILQRFSVQGSVSYAAVAETGLIVSGMMLLAVRKGIFGKEKRKYAAVLAVLSATAVIMAAAALIYGGMGVYYMERIRNFSGMTDTAEHSYLTLQIREAIAECTLTGTGDFAGGQVWEETYRTLLLNSIFTYCGVLAGSAVLLAFLAFVVLALRTAFRQRNRLGFLIGTACSLGIFVRVAAYTGMNFGYNLWWTTMAPFFCYGMTGAVYNGILTGLLMCVYRNSTILAEEKNVDRKLWKRTYPS